jgi:cell wall-associated NlpC family hydrolase
MIYDNLIGKQFILGSQDCLSLFREFYKQNFDIHIRNYARPAGWSSDQLDLMGICHEREGFEKIAWWKPSELRPGDVLCMSVGSRNPNHFAVYIGDGFLIHHLAHRLSSKEVFRDFWINSVAYILRHPKVPDLRPVHPDVTLQELFDVRVSFAG